MGKRYNILLTVAIVALLCAGSWILGKRYGVEQAMAIASSQLSSAEAQSIIEQLQKSLSEAKLGAEREQQSLEMVTARAQGLQSLLDEQLRDNVADSRDLALYRRIEAGDGVREVVIESLVWDPAQPTAFELAVLQWQGRDRVIGQLQLSLNFEQVASAEIDNTNDAGEPVGSQLTIDLDPIPFDFRFFQRFVVQLPTELVDVYAGKSAKQSPLSVTVKVTPADKRIRAPDTLFLWSDIEQ